MYYEGTIEMVDYMCFVDICVATVIFFFFNRHCNPCGLWLYWVFSARRFLQSAVASGTSNPQLGGPVIRTFQLQPPGVPHVWNDASEPQQRKVEQWARNYREFCRKWGLPRHFWVLLHAVNYDMVPTALLPLRRKACWGFFPQKNPTASAGFEPANSGTKRQHAYL